MLPIAAGCSEVVGTGVSMAHNSARLGRPYPLVCKIHERPSKLDRRGIATRLRSHSARFQTSPYGTGLYLLRVDGGKPFSKPVAVRVTVIIMTMCETSSSFLIKSKRIQI